MRLLLSKAEREFLEDLIRGKIEKYSYHYKKVLKRLRINYKRYKLPDNFKFWAFTFFVF